MSILTFRKKGAYECESYTIIYNTIKYETTIIDTTARLGFTVSVF